MNLSLRIRHWVNRTSARYGRLRFNVIAGWIMISVFTLIATLLVSELYTRPQLVGLIGQTPGEANTFATHFLLLVVVMLVFLATLVFSVLYYGVVKPLESFRSSAKSQLGQLEGLEDYRAENVQLAYEMRRRTEQLEVALDDNERLRVDLNQAEVITRGHVVANQNLIENVSDLVAYVDLQGKLTEISPLACEFLQWHRTSILGESFDRVFNIFDSYRDNPREYPIKGLIGEVIARASSVPKITEVLLVTPRKDERKVKLRLSCALGEDGKPIGVVVRVLNDSAGSGGALAAVESSRLDHVTNLLSDAVFDLRLRELIEIARSQSCLHALLLISPDTLRVISEEHGFRAGDEVLWRTARLVEEHVGKDVEVYRVGQDMIGLLRPFAELQKMGDMADRLCLASAARPFVWNETQHDCTLSIGGVEISSLSEGIESLLHKTHQALVSARHQGGGVVQLAKPDEVLVTRRRQDDDWISWLTPRLERGFGHLSSQSIISLAGNSGKAAMFEVFVRIEDEDGVWVTPEFFMPALERRQLSHKLDLWVIQTLLAEMGKNKALISDFECACINLSGWSLSEPDFGESVRELIWLSGVPGSKICFELTEPQVASHLSETLRFMESVRPLGVRFALDRYRAMGGLHGLKDAPLDYVKIHPSLTSGLRDENADSIERLHLTWINKICQARGIKTVALGVEHEQTLNVLRTLEIGYAQGVQVNKIGPLVT